jgi:hypothetical protein
MRARAGLAIATVAGALATPAAAAAGTYQVRACFDQPGHGWVGNHSWGPEARTPFVAAYSQCPGEGIVTRMSGGSGTAPWGAGASHALVSPPGTWFIRFSANVLVNEDRGWYAGLADASIPAWIWCGTGTCSTWGTYQPIDIPVNTNHLHAQAVCGAGSCPRDALYGIFAMRDVVATIEDNTPPSVEITGGLWSPSGWLRGDPEVQFAARDGAGIREVKLRVDGQDQWRFEGDCSDLRPRPCGDAASTLIAPAAAFGSDGRHTVTVEAVDAGWNRVETSRDVWTDRNPPGKPLDLRLDGSAEWRSTNRFAIRWTNPVQDASPIAGVHVQLCPTAAAAQQACVLKESRANGISAIDGLQVPGPGEWRVVIWLEDAAGNVDRERSETLAGLRFDDAPPTVAFAPQDMDDPARVLVVASDSISGIARGQIEIRRSDETGWRALPTTPTSAGFDALVDDEALADGDYHLRAWTADHAGNERSTQSRQNGEPATLALPVRIRSRIVVGRKTRLRANGSGGRRYRTILVARPRARFGRTIPLAGRVTTPGGNPLADADLEVFERVELPGAGWRRIATVRTGRYGWFRFKALRGPSRMLRFRFPGNRLIQGRSDEVELHIRAHASLRVSRHSVVNGEQVTFRGRLSGGSLAAPGKLVQLQVYARGGWLTFATPRANPRTGRWSHDYRFAATRGRVRYRFRAWIPAEASYPYDGGASNKVEVVVRGL